MSRPDYPQPIQELVSALKTLPGIGARSAGRIAVWMLGAGGDHARGLAEAIQSAQEDVGICDGCGFYVVAGGGCVFCADPGRDPSSLCVVEQPTDILPIERTGGFRGHYHVLGGKLSPLDNVTPSDLRLEGLVARVRAGGVGELILALGSDVEGEATTNYLAGLFRGVGGLRVTRLAQGLPAGGGLDNADELTLLRAFDGRRHMGEG